MGEGRRGGEGAERTDYIVIHSDGARRGGGGGGGGSRGEGEEEDEDGVLQKDFFILSLGLNLYMYKLRAEACLKFTYVLTFMKWDLWAVVTADAMCPRFKLTKAQALT